jgi:hypothetical protein
MRRELLEFLVPVGRVEIERMEARDQIGGFLKAT